VHNLRGYPTLALLCFIAATLFVHDDALGQADELARIATYQGSDRSERLLRGAAKEGALTLYSAVPAEASSALANAFARKSGIRVNLWRAACDEIRTRVLAESRTSRSPVDVVLCNATGLQALREQNLLQEVVSPLTDELLPQALPDHRQWAGAFVMLLASGYNTRSLAKPDLPASYRDMLQMRPRGALGVEATEYEWFGAVCEDLGVAQCTALFTDIGRQHGYSLRKGHGLLANLVGSGEVPFALTVYGTAVEIAKSKGAPIDWLAMKPLLGQPAGVALAQRTTHPHAAMLFYDFVLGEAQALLRDQHFIVMSRKHDSDVDRASIKIANPETSVRSATRWQKLFDSVFLARSR
jgi:ABC-type Fe3+ transport system substrate-binding protein